MFASARSLRRGATLRADLCIVGAGAAGITLARALSGSGQQVIVLESGGFAPDPDTQRLYQGTIEGQGQAPLDASRLRYFGGTTNHWEGLCGPLDALDFEVRPWVPHSGWPLDRQELLPWYDRAHPICELGPRDFGEAGWGEFAATPASLREIGARVVLTQHSPPTRFGVRYREELAAARDVRVLLDANALALVPDADGHRLVRVEAATLGGLRFSVEARRFALACGAIENARLLLLSTGAGEAGLGNGHDLVGRFFLDHPRLRPAGLVVWSDLRARHLAEMSVRDGVRATLGLGLDPDLQRRERLLQTAFFTEAHHALAEVEGIPPADAAIARFVRRLAGDTDPASLSICWLRAEQAPRAESRVRLSDERDALGQRRVALEWRMGDIDRHTHTRAARLYAELLTRAGIARVGLDPEVLEEGDDPWRRVTSDWHQLGTTRMAEDPRDGVVDPDCRVFGIDNLWVAGGSVFPTGGCTNPTLTIVALALRLAQRLAALAS